MARTISSVVVVLAALLLAGCTGPKPDGINTVDINTVDYPLDVFGLTAAELDVTTRASYALTQQCVRRFDEEIPPLRHSVARAPEDDRYGLANEKIAGNRAYSADAPAPDVVPWEVAIDPKSRLFTVVNGADSRGGPAGIADLPEGGCHGEAGRVLWQGVAATRDPAPELDDRAWRSSREAPAVRDAAAGWRRCMAEKGYDLADPVEAPHRYWGERRATTNAHLTLEQRQRGVPPDEEERRAALEDVRCKYRSGFLRAWVDADIAAQSALITENLDRLTAHRRALDQVVSNARRVIGS